MAAVLIPAPAAEISLSMRVIPRYRPARQVPGGCAYHGVVEAIEALLTVQAAMADRGLPAHSVGGPLESSRTFIVVLAPEDRQHRPAVTELLTAMGCEVTIGRYGYLYATLAGRLQPAPPLPDVQVVSSDSCSAAELAAVAGKKTCAGPCGRQLDVTEFVYLSKATGRRCSYCLDCDHARQKRVREARRAAALQPML
jgi:hypothetical protein